MSYAAYDDDSTTGSLMQFRDAFSLDPMLRTNSLTPEERAALRRSDRKAGQILGVTLTRDVKAHGMQDLGVRRTPLAVLQAPTVPQADSFVDAVQNMSIGALMAAVGAKRARSRGLSLVTLVGALKDLGSGLRLDKLGRKKLCFGALYPRSVGLDQSQVDGRSLSRGSATAVNDDTDSEASPTQSFLELDEEAYVITPTYTTFPNDSIENVNSDEYEEEEEEFVWHVCDPFAAPKHLEGHKLLQEHFAKLRLRESVGPLDQPTTVTVPFDPIPGSIPSPPCSRRSSGTVYRSSEQLGASLPDAEGLDYLLALDAAEAAERARRKHKRDTLRSRLKKLAILGDEARPAVDGETSQ